LQIHQELTKLWPWLGWHPFLTHGVDKVPYHDRECSVAGLCTKQSD